MLLSIIIVNYNTEYFLERCLDLLFKNYKDEINKDDFEVIVLDNASVNPPVDLLTNKFPWVQFVNNNNNLGFAVANNIGIKRAKGSYILLLNPDTVVPTRTLTTMLSFMKNNPQVGVASCKVVLPSGKIDDASHRGFPTPWRALTYFSGLSKLFPSSIFFNGYHLGYQNMNTTHDIDACVGAFMLIRRSAGSLVNWLDEDYFWYGEDLDFCYKVKETGFTVTFVPSVYVIHHKGAASGIKKHSRHLSLADSGIRKRATQARYDAMRIFYKKHYLQKYPSWMTKLVLFGISVMQKISEVRL